MAFFDFLRDLFLDLGFDEREVLNFSKSDGFRWAIMAPPDSFSTCILQIMELKIKDRHSFSND